MQPSQADQSQAHISLPSMYGDVVIRAATSVNDIPGTLVISGEEPIFLNDPRAIGYLHNEDDQQDDEITIIPIPGTHLDVAAIGGDVRIFGYIGDITLTNVAGDVHVNGLDGELTVANVAGDTSLRGIFSVHGKDMSGDVGVQDVRDSLTLDNVSGDVTLTQIGRCSVQRIGGDFTATDIFQNCDIESVAGDVRLLDIPGQVRIAQIKGDLKAENLVGGITTVVSGDAFIETELGASCTYTIDAASIVLRVRSPIHAQFVAESNGGEIRTHLPLTVERHRQHLVGIIGDGTATVTLNSRHGEILLDAAKSQFNANRGKESGDGIHIHIKDGEGAHTFDIRGPFLDGLGLSGIPFTWPPFTGGATMNNNNNNPSPTAQELEQRLRDLGERGGRAARKAGEKVKEYTDKAQSRARDTDWESVSREVRSAVERTVSELEIAFREIVAEFQTPGPNTPTNGDPNAVPPTTAQRPATPPTAQRVPIDLDPTGTTSGVEDVAARRRAILEQVKSGDITLEEAEQQLRNI